MGTHPRRAYADFDEQLLAWTAFRWLGARVRSAAELISDVN